MCQQEITILFDEHGTPTFNSGRENTHFIGVGIAYKTQDEQRLFDKCANLFGLKKRKPKKNSQINRTTANEIAQLIATLPTQICISSIDLANGELQRKVKLYEEFGSLLRERHRNIRGRPLAQFLHSKILDQCLYNLICTHIEHYQANTRYQIFIDNWSIPQHDECIYLNNRSKSLENMINKLIANYFPRTSIQLTDIALLKDDNSQKRFIDIITSVISRQFLPDTHKNFDKAPFTTINQIASNNYFDITADTISFVTRRMDEFSRNPPVS